MNIEEKNIALFEKYLSHEMDEKTILEFEAKLIYDFDFKNQFESFKSIESGIKQHYSNELKQKFSEIDIELDKKLSIKPNNNNKVIWLSTAVAASIIFGVFIYQHFSNHLTMPQLAQENWVQDEGLPVKMSGKGRYDDAMNAYKLENWVVALTELDKIKSDTAIYYSGIIFFEKKEFETSLNTFNEIGVNSVYYDEAQFRKALIYLALEKKKQAKILLSKIRKNKESIYQEQVKSIIESL